MGEHEALAPAKGMNRSSEELAMRDQVEAWGRARWPDARVVHELVVDACRIDMAFVRPADLIGVEIKSSKDVLDRLDKQIATFRAHIPEVWLAVAPKWKEEAYRAVSILNVMVIESDKATGYGAGAGFRPGRNDLVTASMLRLLWAAEARAIARRMRVSCLPRTPLRSLLPDLARMLTGAEIVREVCTEIRGRDAFWKADPPLRLSTPHPEAVEAGQ